MARIGKILLTAFFARFRANFSKNRAISNPLIFRQLESSPFSAKIFSTENRFVFN